MAVKPVAFWLPSKTPDPDGGVSSHLVAPSDGRPLVVDAVIETRGSFPIYRPGDIWRMLQGAVFQR